jgi:hypothetical protein
MIDDLKGNVFVGLGGGGGDKNLEPMHEHGSTTSFAFLAKYEIHLIFSKVVNGNGKFVPVLN